MATRFYHNPTAIPTITPAFDAGWEQSGVAVRRCLFTVAPKSGAPAVEVADTETSLSAVFDVLLAQYISEPLEAQTIAGNVSGQILGYESDIAADLLPAVLIRVFDSTGTTATGTLLAQTNGTEFVLTTPTNRSVPASVALTSTPVNKDDVIVVEYGFRATNAVATAYTGTLRFMSGDLTPTDLPVNESATTDNNSWMEFSQTLLFARAGSSHNKPTAFSDSVQYVASAANTAKTITLPAVSGFRHVITGIYISRSATAALVGSKTLYITTLNLPNNLSWAVGDAMAAGGTRTDVSLSMPVNSLCAVRPSTPTVIALPAAGANVLWNARVTYMMAPAL